MGLRSLLKAQVKKTLGMSGSSSTPGTPIPSPKSNPPPPAMRPAPAPAPAPTPAPAVELSEEERVKQEKVARHFEKARKGVLRFVEKSGGRASLADMHSHSEMRYFIGHQKFSRLMEGLTGEGLLLFHASEGEGELTDAGRDYIA